MRTIKLEDVVCPVCGSRNDYCEYVFVAHHQNENRHLKNPSDFHIIRMCPNLHFFDISGEVVEARK